MPLEHLATWRPSSVGRLAAPWQDPGVRPGKHEGDMAITHPFDDKRRRPVRVLYTDDQADAVAIAINDQAIADMCFHGGPPCSHFASGSRARLLTRPERGLFCHDRLWSAGSHRAEVPQSAGEGPSDRGRQPHAVRSMPAAPTAVCCDLLPPAAVCYGPLRSAT